MGRVLLSLALLLCTWSTVFAQANGRLQIHFIDVGQGDSAILISPKGETVLFDNGVEKYCNMPVSYLRQIGITKIDYHIASHYHADHIGCTSEVLGTFPLTTAAYDRGSSYSSNVFTKYLKAIGSKRKTASPGEKIVLDASATNPVAVEFVASNGDGTSTGNENDLSLVAVIRFGRLDAVMGGDLSGFNSGDYRDIESSVADKVGRIEVYKVNHHCSSYSSNPKWLRVTSPKVAIISASATRGKNYNHPTVSCLKRLHDAGVRTYWTEPGTGGQPNPQWDLVAENILVEMEPGKDKFKVASRTRADVYFVWDTENSTESIVTKEMTYVWSKKSRVYHYEDCEHVSKIAPGNLETGSVPPTGKTLHVGCPAK